MKIVNRSKTEFQKTQRNKKRQNLWIKNLPRNQYLPPKKNFKSQSRKKKSSFKTTNKDNRKKKVLTAICESRSYTIDTNCAAAMIDQESDHHSPSGFDPKRSRTISRARISPRADGDTWIEASTSLYTRLIIDLFYEETQSPQISLQNYVMQSSCRHLPSVTTARMVKFVPTSTQRKQKGGSGTSPQAELAT
mmetsp:Transcript_3719/g.6900  ORF Transcript_3719/g.6900 Transcript_3719/m.6900 type:complete len:192 (-) Transcript_3719:2797-3372(-)